MPLTISIPRREFYAKGKFIEAPRTELTLEHSLLAIRKWESKWEIPFLQTMSDKKLTDEQWRDYVRCMTLTKNVNPMVYFALTKENLESIVKYMDKPMTAARFSGDDGHRSGKFVSAETILYGMFKFNIPLECQKWHLNQLRALIQYFSNEEAPKKKMSKEDILKRNRALNKARRKPKGRKH